MIILLISCSESKRNNQILPDVPEGAQAVSLMGEKLFSAPPSEGLVSSYENAKKNYEMDRSKPDNLIWFGRWTAYKGDYREAIRIFSDGIKRFPQDARFYRHRGHRYISIREFDRAISDFEKAVDLIEGKEDKIEPDGKPNAMNIPVSSLHSNIWYHLGLAYYLKNDLINAENAYRIAVETSTNDDKLVSTTHWLYMILRLQNKDEEAEKVLGPIIQELNVIENLAYHDLCLFYKGELGMVTGVSFTDIMDDAVLYGIGNWYFYNEQAEKAKEVFEKILKKDSWASFGYIAAETDYLRSFYN